jgi:TPR repeat protein
MRAAAERGDVNAQYDMYDRCWIGRGVERDVTTALMWCRTAANSGHALAERGLAMCYAGGYGVCKDEKEAFKWMKRAAEHGDLASSLDLSIWYSRGIGTEKNPGRQGPIDKAAIVKAEQILRDYRNAKQMLDRKIVESEEWWRLRHWETVGKTDGVK